MTGRPYIVDRDDYLNRHEDNYDPRDEYDDGSHGLMLEDLPDWGDDEAR